MNSIYTGSLVAPPGVFPVGPLWRGVGRFFLRSPPALSVLGESPGGGCNDAAAFAA
jgi:hypothetical protein